jgi:cell division protein FtsB
MSFTSQAPFNAEEVVQLKAENEQLKLEVKQLRLEAEQAKALEERMRNGFVMLKGLGRTSAAVGHRHSK